VRHSRGYRGSRRSSIPRSTVRSAKYIVQQAGASEAAGLQAVTVCKGVDNATLGQTGPTDADVPTGCKIAKFEIFMPKVNLGASTANFIHWTLQRVNTGQAVVSPLSPGGNPLRNNIMLSGVLGLGAGQNNQLHISYKIPPKMQRIADGQVWSIVTDNGLAVSTVYEFIFKPFV